MMPAQFHRPTLNTLLQLAVALAGIVCFAWATASPGHSPFTRPNSVTFVLGLVLVVLVWWVPYLPDRATKPRQGDPRSWWLLAAVVCGFLLFLALAAARPWRADGLADPLATSLLVAAVPICLLFLLRTWDGRSSFPPLPDMAAPIVVCLFILAIGGVAAHVEAVRYSFYSSLFLGGIVPFQLGMFVRYLRFPMRVTAFLVGFLAALLAGMALYYINPPGPRPWGYRLDLFAVQAAALFVVWGPMWLIWKGRGNTR